MSWSSEGMESMAHDYHAHMKIAELEKRIEQLQKEVVLLSRLSAKAAITAQEIEAMIDFVPDDQKDDARFLIKAVERNLDVKMAAVSGNRNLLLDKFMTEWQADLLIKVYRK